MDSKRQAEIAAESSPEERANAVSALGQRNLVGWLGVALPLLCYIFSLGGGPWQSSISSYYYTSVHGPFVAILCGLGMVLYVYSGYDKWDIYASNIAAFAAFGVGLFATLPLPDPEKRALEDALKPDTPLPQLQLFGESHQLTGYIHTGCAVVLFLMFYFFSAFLFTRRPPVPGKPPTFRELLQTAKQTWLFLKASDKSEPAENDVHRRCAWVILAGMLGCAVVRIGEIGPTGSFQWFTFFEAIAILAFAWSWLSKNKRQTNMARLIGSEAKGLMRNVRSFFGG